MNLIDSMIPAMTLAVVGGLLSLVFRDFATGCAQLWGPRHTVTRHAHLLSRAITAIWLAACVGAAHALTGR